MVNGGIYNLIAHYNIITQVNVNKLMESDNNIIVQKPLKSLSLFFFFLKKSTW